MPTSRRSPRRRKDFRRHPTHIEVRRAEKGDITFHLSFAEEGEQYTAMVEDMRTRSQQDDSTIFWVVPLNDAIDRMTVELYRSKDMLSRKSRDAKTADETALVSEERSRERRFQAELQRQLRQAVLAGTAYFRGNDRSPSGSSSDVAKAAGTMLGDVLPDVFTRFNEGAVKGSEASKGLELLLKASDLQGLPSVFTALNVLDMQDGKTIIDPSAPALHELYGKIEHDSELGNKATGRSLADDFGREPFGWDFDVVRLLVGCLLAADKVQIRSGATDIDNRRAPGAREALTNNNTFRSASVSPKKGIGFPEVVKASINFKDTFGTEVREINQSTVAAELREALGRIEDDVQTALSTLTTNRFPGADLLQGALERIKTVQRGTEDVTIGEFNSSHQTIKDGIKRAGELNSILTPPVVHAIETARRVLQTQWPFLESESDLDESLRDVAANLRDLLDRETFFRELADIESHKEAIEKEHDRRFGDELQETLAVYAAAIEELVATPGWSDLDDAVRTQIAAPLHANADEERLAMAEVSQLRSDRDACPQRLQTAVEQVHHVIEGDRVFTLNVKPYFRDGVEDLDQLLAALDGLRQECERLIADGKKIIVG